VTCLPLWLLRVFQSNGPKVTAHMELAALFHAMRVPMLLRVRLSAHLTKWPPWTLQSSFAVGQMVGHSFSHVANAVQYQLVFNISQLM
jgi:hypothetical protein